MAAAMAMAPVVDPFLGWLIDEQTHTGETDTDYAARRGLSREHYSNVRRGRRRLSREQVERICQLDETARAVYNVRCLMGPSVPGVLPDRAHRTEGPAPPG